MQSILDKARSIRLLILDVDGILTSGIVYYGNSGAELKGFHLHDGLGIKLLQNSGVTVAVISGKKSRAVEHRLNDINVQHVYLGHEHKVPAYEELRDKFALKDHEIAMMGDDLPDLPLLCRAGLAITVPHAPEIIKQKAHLITKNLPGLGAVREACEFIIKAQDNYQSMIQSYLSK